MFPALLFISSIPAALSLSNFAIKRSQELLLLVNVVVPNLIVSLLKKPVIYELPLASTLIPLPSLFILLP